MKKAVLAVLVLGIVPVLSAHHSYGMFDMNREQVITGTVVAFEWTNPHSWLIVEATTGGAPLTWNIEMASPGILGRTGWKRNTLKAGDKVEVTMHPLRDGALGGSFVRARTADGKVVAEIALPSPLNGTAAGQAGN